MTFELAATRAASLVLAVAATLAGCGGGSIDSTASAAAVDTNATQNPAAAATTAEVSSDSATIAAITTDVDTNGSASVPAAVQVALLNDLASTPAPAQSAEISVATEVATASPISTQTATATATDSASPASTSSVVLTTPVSAGTAKSGVGMNLTAVFPYSAEMPSIDLMKKSSPWITQCKLGGLCNGFASSASAYDTLEEGKLQLDADGWLKSLPASSDSSVKYRTVTTKLAESAVQQAGNYVVRYDGSGTITYSGAGKKDVTQSSTGRDIVIVENSDNNPLFLSITATDPTNYIRNIRVYMPGGGCQNNLAVYAPAATSCTATAGKFIPFESYPSSANLWHPAFLASLKGFRTLRFMDWGKANSSPIVNWTDRTNTASRTWNMPSGVPIEQMFDLAAKVGADPWMNIPPYASDAYVKSFAQLAHSHLAVNSKLALEYGNEMWNYSFAATKWSQKQSQITFAAQAAAGGNASVLQLNWYAMRLAQVCKIVKTEFGADASRVQCVANTQASNSWNTNQVLECTYAKTILGQACAKFFDAVAVAPYFGSYIGGSRSSAEVTSWAADSDGGLGKMFLEINGTHSAGLPTTPLLAAFGSGAGAGAVAQAATWMTATKAVVDVYGLPMWAYEGGQSLIPSTGTPALIGLMSKANRDPRMGTAYETMLTDWKRAGGQTFVLFADVGVYSKSGMWGLRENQFDTSAPKWRTTAQWRDSVSCWWAGC